MISENISSNALTTPDGYTITQALDAAEHARDFAATTKCAYEAWHGSELHPEIFDSIYQAAYNWHANLAAGFPAIHAAEVMRGCVLDMTQAASAYSKLSIRESQRREFLEQAINNAMELALQFASINQDA